jgi:hypothetical protein
VPTVERFKGVVERAGFGTHPNHKAIIGLTEAEAAAVHTARMFPRLFEVDSLLCFPQLQANLGQNRDVLLVRDVGGGKTVSR